MTSLCHRCSLKCDDERTIKRSMKQTKSLLKDYNDVRASIARRMDLFFASGMKAIWTLEENLANIILQYKTNYNNNIKEAKKIFTKLGLWENVIVCYNLLNWKHKATEIFKLEISKKPTVKLWCLLGDATEDVSHYEVAWRLSQERSSRVQKHWGVYYFVKKNYVEAVPHLKLSIELKKKKTKSQELVWFMLGFAALQIEDWKLAVKAYRHYCALKQFSFKAWNNLARAYIKLGDKPEARECLLTAIICNYNCWKVWDKLMVVSIDLKHFSEVIECYHRILDMENNHLNVKVLQILTNAIINNINDADGNPALCLLQDSLALFERIISNISNIVNNPDIWRMYAELVVLRKTDVDEEKAAQYLRQAYRSITSKSKWCHREDTTLNILESCCNLTQTYLRCTTDIAVIKTRKMLRTIKLSLQKVVKKVQEQEWDNTNIIELLMKVEKYLAIVNELK